jgi:hypothetical protein
LWDWLFFDQGADKGGDKDSESEFFGGALGRPGTEQAGSVGGEVEVESLAVQIRAVAQVMFLT